jgi:hypothetical protein
MRRCTVRILLSSSLSLVAADIGGQQPAPRPNNGGLPAVSPDGGTIAFVSNRGGAQDVCITSVDGAVVRQITRTPEPESASSRSRAPIPPVSSRSGS